MKFIPSAVIILLCLVASYFGITQLEKFSQNHTTRVETLAKNKNVLKSIDEVKLEIAPLEAKSQELQKTLLTITQSNAALNADSKLLLSEVEGLDQKIKVNEDEFSKLDNSLNDVLGVIADLGLGGDVDVENFSKKVEELEKEISGNNLKIVELNSVLEAASSRLNTIKNEEKNLVVRELERAKRIRNNSLEAQVVAVDNEWGFILIDAGREAGFTSKRKLILKRDDTHLGKITPTKVEANHTIAEINYSTLSPGVRIQPGDQVIFEEVFTN